MANSKKEAEKIFSKNKETLTSHIFMILINFLYKKSLFLLKKHYQMLHNHYQTS